MAAAVQRLSVVAIAVLALVLGAPQVAHAAQIVVARDHGLSAAERTDLRHDAGVRHVRDLAPRDVEVVTVAAGDANAALETLRASADVRWAEIDQPVQALGTDDPYFSAQWALPAIGAPAAWSVANGAGQLVGVVDTGVDATHPDLLGQLDPRGAATDPNGHGTHVAGIIAAVAGNGIGAAGAAPGARVLALQALDANGFALRSAVADAEARAADLGARVVNLSLGGDAPSLLELTVIRSHPDTLFVAAAGNDGRDADAGPKYPCAYDEPNVMCVGAEARDGTATPFSNTGARNVDLFAPGEQIVSTWPGGGYRYASGTSMATPFVAAAAAALLEHDPSLTPAQVRQRLIDTSDPDPALAGKAVGGVLDVARALDVRQVDVPTPAAPAPSDATQVPSSAAAAGTASAPPSIGAARRAVLSGMRLVADARTRSLRLHWHLARATSLAVRLERRRFATARSRWTTVRRWAIAGRPGSGNAVLRVRRATLGRGRYRIVLATAGSTCTSRQFAVGR